VATVACFSFSSSGTLSCTSSVFFFFMHVFCTVYYTDIRICLVCLSQWATIAAQPAHMHTSLFINHIYIEPAIYRCNSSSS
jgi:hypothetical protein